MAVNRINALVATGALFAVCTTSLLAQFASSPQMQDQQNMMDKRVG